jgi:hypothetical protein
MFRGACACSASNVRRTRPARSGGDQRSLEQFHFAGAEHIPGDDPDEDTDSFGQSGRDGGGLQPPPQLPAVRVLLFSPQASALIVLRNAHVARRKASFAGEEMLACGGEKLLAVSLNSLIWSSFSLFSNREADDRGAPTRLQSLRQLSVTFCDSGQLSVKRAPPSGDSAALALPPCCSRPAARSPARDRNRRSPGRANGRGG